MRILRIIVVFILLGAASATSVAAEHLETAKEAVWSEAMPGPVYLVPAWAARMLSLGHPTLAADYYWMGALQYFGEPLNVVVAYKDLHRFIDRVNALDPDFHYAYRFGGEAIPWNKGNWTWANVGPSNAILERGLKRFPDDWRMWMQLGFNRGVLGHNDKGAAVAYRHAAAVKGSPPWLPGLVARLLATAGRVNAAITYTQALLAHARAPQMRASLHRRLLELYSQENLDQLNRAIAQYRKRHGAPPKTIDDLIADGLIDGMPRDPLGGSYSILHGRAYATAMPHGQFHVFSAFK